MSGTNPFNKYAHTIVINTSINFPEKTGTASSQHYMNLSRMYTNIYAFHTMHMHSYIHAYMDVRCGG